MSWAETSWAEYKADVKLSRTATEFATLEATFDRQRSDRSSQSPGQQVSKGKDAGRAGLVGRYLRYARSHAIGAKCRRSPSSSS